MIRRRKSCWSRPCLQTRPIRHALGALRDRIQAWLEDDSPEAWAPFERLSIVFCKYAVVFASIVLFGNAIRWWVTR